jgi:hypothetical protein
VSGSVQMWHERQTYEARESGSTVSV